MAEVPMSSKLSYSNVRSIFGLVKKSLPKTPKRSSSPSPIFRALLLISLNLLLIRQIFTKILTS